MNRNPGSTGSCSRPELTRRFDNQCKFPALVVFGDRIAGNGAGKTALRADGKAVEVDVAARFVDRLVTAGAEIVTLEITAAHMHADGHLRWAFGDGVVDALDIEIDERVRIAARTLDLVADCRIAQKRDGDFVELHIPATGLGELGNLLLKHF